MEYVSRFVPVNIFYLRPYYTINPAGYPMDNFKLTPSAVHVKCHTGAERAGGGDKSKFLNCVYLFEWFPLSGGKNIVIYLKHNF